MARRSDENTKEDVAHCFRLHVVAEHLLSWVAVVLGRRQESCKRVVDETIALVCGDAEMSRENRKSGERRAVTHVIEDAKGVV